MQLLIAAARAALVDAACPHCHAAQTRARVPRGTKVKCRYCHKPFEPRARPIKPR
jgi:hypothetical protein